MEIKPEKVINSNETITGVYRGSVRIVDRATLIINGTQQGSLCVENGDVIINGMHQGSVSVHSGSHVVNQGSMQGSVHIMQGGRVENTSKAKLAGSLGVFGTLINYGVRGGTVSGDGEIIDKPGSQVKLPQIINGANVYGW